jgi:predicted dienelactone hydrolase
MIMLVPERSTLRSRIPPAALRSFQETLERGFGADAPPVLDLRDGIPDDQFHDDLHLKLAGRRRATQELAQALRKRAASAEHHD